MDFASFAFFMVTMKGKKSVSLRRRKRAKPFSVPGVGPQAGVALRSRANEVKCVDTFGTTTVKDTPTVSSLISISAGGDIYQRVGRQITLKACHLRFWFNLTGAAVYNDYIKYAIVYDAAPNGIAPTYGDVYTGTSAAGVATSASYSYPNPAGWDRFTIIFEENIALVPANNAVVPPSSASFNQDPNVKIQINKYVPLKNMVARYLDGTAGIPATGGLFLIVCGQLSGATINQNYVSNIRVTWVDA